jgi:vacuolar protein sorting-associated protein 29
MRLLSSCRYHIRTENDKWFVNPGSITGAFSAISSDILPSFILMAVQGAKVVAFVYELKDGNVVVSKSEFTKAL